MTTRILIGARDVANATDVATPYSRQLTGGEQLLAKNAEAVAWLAKVYGEMTQETRDWSIFDRKRLGAFLEVVGVDTDAAVKAHGDTMPPPPSVAKMESCLGCFRGASFLNVDEQEACLLIEGVTQRSPHRR